jgi:hypothetical protein
MLDQIGSPVQYSETSQFEIRLDEHFSSLRIVVTLPCLFRNGHNSAFKYATTTF